MNRIPLLIGIVTFAIYQLTYFLTRNPWISLLVFVVPIGLLTVNLLLRRRLSYSKWFLSPANVLLERTVCSIPSEISTGLLYEKLLEVVKDSDFKLLDTDDRTLCILLGTSVNFWTWGENIYIRLESSSEESVIHFTSVTLFGNKSWKRNDQNFETFIHSFESSLTI